MDNEKLNSNTKEKRVLDSVEAAQYLGISYWLIRKLVREKKIPYYKIESKTLFTKEILDKYIQDSLEEPKKKVKYSFDNHIFKTQYVFENISNPTNDILKYTAYLTSNNKYQIIEDFDPSLENGSAKLAVKSVSTFEDMIVVEINWTKNSYSIIVYKDKSTLENSTNN